MIYIKKAETEQQVIDHFNDFKIGGVGLATQTDEVIYHKYEKDWSQEYLTFTALESGTFKFSGATTGHTVKYSMDNGTNWQTLARTATTPTVTAGNTIIWKQTGLTPNFGSGIGKFSSTGRFEARGNVMSLYYGDNFYGETNLSEKYCAFYMLFSGCTGLTTAENLSLPATTLADYCYNGMFSGCTSLITAPELPATTLTGECYGSMFSNCTSLTTAPELPATTLANECYYGMFSGCSSLNYIKCLATNISAAACTTDWVNGVSATGTFVKPASTDWSSKTGSNGIPSGWTVQDA